MNPLQVSLVGTSPELVQAWSVEFRALPEVKVIGASIFDVEADAIVSPANSFGHMDGGLDGKIRDYFGESIETAVRDRIRSEFHGELPVGLATIVATGHPRFPYLVCAPTMRIPSEVSTTINAYLAMKALLSASRRHPAIVRLAVPGLCSLTGGMPAPVVARQMRIAYERVQLGKYACSHWREERELETFIRGSGGPTRRGPV